jgi:hypothetical protein
MKLAFYFSMFIFLPHLEYCGTIWGDANSNLVNTLIRFQKRAAKLGWVEIPKRVKFQKAVLMYKVMNGLSRTHLHDLVFSNIRTAFWNLTRLGNSTQHSIA